MKNERNIVLAIDDQPVILHAIASELRGVYRVKTFTSGKAALSYLEKDTTDLILLDYDMPDMNGCEVLNELLANPRTCGIPVIFLTGADNRNTEAEVLEMGASDYIQKPINARVLLTRINLQLELKKYRNHMETLVREQIEHIKQANEQLKLREDITLNLLAEATDMRDHETGSHIKRTTKMVQVLVNDLIREPIEGYILSESEADNIINSAKLHDLGKIAIPDRILFKPGKLEKDEFDVIRQHPSYGAGLFDKYIEKNGKDSFLMTARDIALCHHEKWNGTGYPGGLKGDEIPLPARITALADVYDALTSARPYKEPFPHEAAVNVIAEDSGSHFDPYVVSIFLKNERKFHYIVQNY